MINNKNPFYSVDNRDLSNQLLPKVTSRFLKKDIDRRQALPLSITEGAKAVDVVKLNYFANALFGTYTEVVELNLPTVPIVAAWYLGGIDKLGATVDTAAAQLSGAYYADIFGASGTGGLKFSWNKDEITFTMVSANVGWSNFVDAYIFYAVYYDDTQVSALGF